MIYLGKHKMKVSFIVITLSAILFGCKKKEEISLAPELTFESLTPASIKEYTDSLTLTISYKDADGDLGENSSSVNNLFLKDNRSGVELKYRIKQLAPDNANVAITGKLNITIKKVPIISTTATSESLTYTIYATDRASNKSNEVISSTIIVNK